MYLKRRKLNEGLQDIYPDILTFKLTYLVWFDWYYTKSNLFELSVCSFII